jgi:hypothetical protein
MTSNFFGSSNVSGSKTSAKLYAFPPRGRFAAANESGSFEPAAEVQMPRGVRIAPASGWYHDEAIKAERTGKNQN